MNDVMRPWAQEITTAWGAARESILRVSEMLIAAKEGPEALPHGLFERMVENELPFSAATARRLMAIGRNGNILNRAHAHVLPNSWYTLYELTKLDEDSFNHGIELGIIRPDMERRDVAQLRMRTRQSENTANAPVGPATCTISDLGTMATAGHKFGVIYADPPWLYDNQGTRAATGNHYSGMTVDELCALPIQDLAADDAHLHLWTTNGFLFECPRIFEAWGFEFRSSFIWVKPQMGIGNYWRNSHEFLLTAIRGDAKRFDDKSLMSWLECDRGAHSAKPEQVRHMIETASPGPRLELFGRSPAEGWVVWGNQISRDLLNKHIEEAA